MKPLRLALLVVLLCGLLPGKCQTVTACAMIRGGTPATDGSSKDYPCGAGVLCTDTTPHSCCGKYGQCTTLDGQPDCEYATPDDPADPTMLRRKPKRGARSLIQ